MKKVLGTIVGLIFSVLGIILWIVLSVWLGIIAGLAGGLMGILFILGYRQVNKEDKSVYPYILACIVTILEIILAEWLSLVIIAVLEHVDIAYALTIPEIKSAIIRDVALGLLLSAFVVIAYIVSDRRKNRAQAKRVAAPLAPEENTNTEEKENEL